MAYSLPLVTTGLRCPQSTSIDGGHGRTHPSSGGVRNEDPINWCAWAHQGHRLWVGMPDSFWVFTYKVERCPFRGVHAWTTCPFVHRGEHARRRDPRNFQYVAAPCPEYAESKRWLRLAGSTAAPTCPNGLRCGYAHSVFETWLHPTKFRTVMCDAGAGCPRRICFFAHSLAQRRRADDEVPLVVFPVSQPPPPAFVPRAPRMPASSSSTSSTSSSRPPSVSVVAHPVDRMMLAIQQGHGVRLLTRTNATADASSSSSSSRANVATTSVVTPPVQASPVLADNEDIDFEGIVTGCCLASEEDSKAEGSGYPHIDLIMEIMRT